MNDTATASSAVPPHKPCTDLERQSEGLQSDSLHRLILGSDGKPEKLSAAEIQDLGDRVAELLFQKGTFPRTAGDLLQSLEQAVPQGDPLRVKKFFVVGEGTQIAPSPGLVVNRNLRFVVTVGEGPGGPDVVLSAFHPDHGTIELMAWDLKANGFNFYRTVGGNSAWVFAGNSRHALTLPTRDNGPFESHKSGNFLMKELRLPWINWDSPKARAVLSIFAEENLLDHPWVQDLAPGGAYTLEEDVAVPSIQRWTKARLGALVAGQAEETPRRILEQLLTTATVNLASSNTSSAAAVTGSVDRVDLPDTFFVDSEALSGVLGLAALSRPFVSAAIYAQSLQRFGVTLTDDNQFSRPGDTHFAFVVPERAIEDTETLREALDLGIISRRLAACLLMVDFVNPVFSERRAQLLQHVPDTLSAPGADLSQEIADAIRNSPAAQDAATPEHEFAQRWDVGDAFEAPFNSILQPYYDLVAQQLTTESGFNSYMELAESRRDRVRSMPITESAMLFARTTIPSATRRMRTDGTVEAA